MASMRATAERLAASMDLPADREAAADVLARAVRDRHDSSTQRGAVNAARRALGLESIERTFTEATGEIDRGKAARGRKVQRSRREGAKAVKRPGIRSLGATGTASAGGLVAQALGLVLLYFVLRNATTAADALAGVRRGVQWIMEPTPIGGNTP